MAVFVNTLYKRSTAIVPIVPADGQQLTTADFYRDVKQYFNIRADIHFKDSKTTSKIPDAILPAYIEQYRSSAGWSLEVVCNDADDDDNDGGNVGINIRNIMNADILEHLKDIEFQIILATYKKTQSLQNSEHVKLAKIVMRTVLESDINLDLGKQDYIYLSRVICKVFHGELQDIYYSRAINKQKPSGKLFDAYNNYRRQLGVCGLLKRRTYSVAVKKHNSVDMKDPNALDFIKTNTKATCEYVEKWKNSLDERLRILANTSESREDYLQLFPIFEVENNFIFELDLRDVEFLKILSGGEPKVVFMGDFDNLTPYITFNNRTYKFVNPAEAIQNCLALHLALDMSYPAESTVVWNYVQKYVFDVTTTNDLNNSSLKVVHHQLTAN